MFVYTLWHYIYLRSTVDLAFHQHICGLSLHPDVRKCLGLASFLVYRLKFRTLCCFDGINHKVVIFFVAVFVVMKNMYFLLSVVVSRQGLRLLCWALLRCLDRVFVSDIHKPSVLWCYSIDIQSLQPDTCHFCHAIFHICSSRLDLMFLSSDFGMRVAYAHIVSVLSAGCRPFLWLYSHTLALYPMLRLA